MFERGLWCHILLIGTIHLYVSPTWAENWSQMGLFAGSMMFLLVSLSGIYQDIRWTATCLLYNLGHLLLKRYGTSTICPFLRPCPLSALASLVQPVYLAHRGFSFRVHNTESMKGPLYFTQVGHFKSRWSPHGHVVHCIVLTDERMQTHPTVGSNARPWGVCRFSATKVTRFPPSKSQISMRSTLASKT